jgi:addiction module HigA family antidote
MQDTKIRRKVRPTHPGAVLRNMLAEVTAEDSGQLSALSTKELAKHLGVSARVLGDLIHERRTMTADLAIRLSRVFNTTPDIWMNLQKAVDLWDAAQANKNQYAKLRPLAA